MFDVIPMPWDWPVVINFHEAKAFCAWKGPDYRLPSEAEHNVIRGNLVGIYLLNSVLEHANKQHQQNT